MRKTSVLLYSQVSLLADFNSALPGLNFVAFGLVNFTERTDLKVLKLMLALNDILFVFTMSNTFSSDEFKWGSASTSFGTLSNRSNLYFPTQSSISLAYFHKAWWCCIKHKKNPNWPWILDPLYRILIIRDFESGKTNALLNLIKQQDNDSYSAIDKIYLHVPDSNEAKYNNVQDVYKNIED